LVQSELHPADEGREVDGNPGEPHADAAAPRVFEAVDDRSAETLAVSETDRSPERLALPEPAHADGARAFQASDDQGARAFQSSDDQGARAFQASDGDGAAPSDLPAIIPAVPVPLAPADDLRLTSPGIRLSQLKEEFVAWVKTLMSAAVYAVLIVTFGFQVARVEGQSMAPTLEDQDRLIVNKLVYRIGEPRRGDIVMLYYPLNPDKSFVKRVIAEEGDTVRIVDGRVYVNDIPLKDDYVASEYRSHDDWGPQVIPEGYYFVMGDHRNNSSDSRHWGMVPKKYIIGKVQIRWWPVPTARVF
jgi:signal peptidase I